MKDKLDVMALQAIEVPVPLNKEQIIELCKKIISDKGSFVPMGFFSKKDKKSHVVVQFLPMYDEHDKLAIRSAIEQIVSNLDCEHYLVVVDSWLKNIPEPLPSLERNQSHLRYSPSSCPVRIR